MARARRWYARCSSPTCPRSTATKRPRPLRPKHARCVGAQAMARRKDAGHGGHGWFVTFADLMGLMMSFFVMLVAFSNQDQQKLKIVAGSMREAFGVQTDARYSGIVESDGLPTRPRLKNVDHISPEQSSATPTPDDTDRARESGARLKV